MGLYHDGTDGVCFDTVSVFTTNNKYATCNFNGTYLDDEEWLVSKDCIVVGDAL